MKNIYSGFFKNVFVRLVLSCSVFTFLGNDLLAGHEGNAGVQAQGNNFAFQTNDSWDVLMGAIRELDEVNTVLENKERDMISDAVHQLTNSNRIDELRTDLNNLPFVDQNSRLLIGQEGNLRVNFSAIPASMSGMGAYGNLLQILQVGDIVYTRTARDQDSCAGIYKGFISRYLSIASLLLSGADMHRCEWYRAVQEMSNTQSIPNSTLYLDNLLVVRNRILPILKAFKERASRLGGEWASCMQSAFSVHIIGHIPLHAPEASLNDPEALEECRRWLEDLASGVYDIGPNTRDNNVYEEHEDVPEVENIDYVSYIADLENAIDSRIALFLATML